VAELEALNTVVAAIREKGAELVVVTPQTPEHSAKLIEDKGLDYVMLTDENLALSDTLNLTHGFTDELKEIYLSFGIDVGASNGDGEWRLPMPARFIIDPDGTLLDVQVNPDYSQRPEPEEILALLK